MRTLTLFAGALLALAVSTSLSAQQSAVVSSQELDAALESSARSVDADRAVVARVLSREDVERIAESHGLGDRLEDARAVAGQLGGERLTQAAAYARTVEVQLAGGQTITFSAITLIVILLIVILVILIAD
jgi:hypothetical protein